MSQYTKNARASTKTLLPFYDFVSYRLYWQINCITLISTIYKGF